MTEGISNKNKCIRIFDTFFGQDAETASNGVMKGIFDIVNT